MKIETNMKKSTMATPSSKSSFVAESSSVGPQQQGHQQQMYTERSTPLISNRASKSPNPPPPLSLDGAGAVAVASKTAEGSNSLLNPLAHPPSPRRRTTAVFSCPTTEPICVDPSKFATQKELPTMAILPIDSATKTRFDTTATRQQQQEQQGDRGRRRRRRHRNTEYPSLASLGSGGETAQLMVRNNGYQGNAGPIDVLLLQNLAYMVTCDLFKAGVPFQFLQNILGRLKIAIFHPRRRRPPTSISNRTHHRHPSMLNSSPSGKAVSTSKSSTRTSPRGGTGGGGVTEIRGIPNYGQTCFLNSVLQALASLEPFLAYLDKIIQVQDDLSIASSSTEEQEEETSKGGEDRTRRTSYFSRQLLGILEAVNGDYTTKRIDPRRLLKRVGQENSQFRTNYNEQQDAQEVLQAILGVLISDAQLDSTSSLDPCYRFSNHDDNEDNGYGSGCSDDETLTTVLAGGGTAYPVDWSPASSVDGRTNHHPSLNGLVPLSGDSVLSLSCLVQRIDEGKKNFERLGMLNLEDGDFDLASPHKSLSSSTSATVSGTDKEVQSHQREEKKQEDFEISIPFTSSENDLAFPPVKSVGGNGDESKVDEAASHLSEDNSVDNEDHSHGSSTKEGATKLSTSMQILKTTISSITPSPLSGWLGSTLRCCNCKHVRPIQNAPFLDIPIVPRAVSDYLAKGMAKSMNSPNVSQMPHCSLDQCLHDFISVERVSDVECRACSIKTEMARLDDEVMLLKGAISTMEKKIKKKGGKPEEETKGLREELNEMERRLMKLKSLDPDDDDSAGVLAQFQNDVIIGDDIMNDLSENDDETKKPRPPLERCDAKKYLIMTRCPPILCCHVQRRYYDPNTDRMEKCIQFVEFPSVLDLSPYCAYGPQASTPWAAGGPHREEQKDSSSNNGFSNTMNGGGGKMPYKLRAVIEHRGNAFGGHYVSYRTNHKGEWFRISDDNKTPIPWRQVQMCQAYMLFYEAI